jgi:hypothetical protein
MQRLGWAWTVRLATICLTLAVGGCDSSKTGSSNTAETGGAASGSAGKGSRGGATAAGAGNVSGNTSSGTNGGAAGTSGGASTGGRTMVSGGTAGAHAACTANADCANSTGSQKLCSVPTNECVECLTVSDCAAGAMGAAGAAGAAGASSMSVANLGCVKNTCVNYTTCVNSLGCASGEVCDSTLGRCVQCSKDADCPSGSRCGQNQCRATCTSDKDCTPLGLLCNSSAGYCVRCNSTADCASNQFCSGGECLRDVCVANSTRCQSNGISTCFADGSGWGTPVACASGRTCTTSTTGVAACQAWVCTPSTTACSSTEEKVISCSADGMTATTVTDCAAKSQVCVSGACAAVVCTAGQRFCQSNAVRTCSAKGDSSSLYTSCSTSQYCDSATATCKALVCTPNQPGCNVNVATTCNSDGSAWVTGGIDCAAGSSGQVCSTATGTCQSQLCTPNAYFCDTASAPNKVMLCGSTGLTSSLSQTCSSSQFCDASTTTPTCKTLVCNPSAPTCNGNVATTCNSLGSGYAAGGTDCSTTTSTKTCNPSSGACENLACSPNTYFCDTTPGAPPAIRYCSSTGLTSTISASSTSGYYCNVTSPMTTLPSAPFTAKTCTPGQPICNGTTATKCNSLGSGYAAGGTDCFAYLEHVKPPQRVASADTFATTAQLLTRSRAVRLDPHRRAIRPVRQTSIAMQHRPHRYLAQPRPVHQANQYAMATWQRPAMRSARATQRVVRIVSHQRASQVPAGRLPWTPRILRPAAIATTAPAPTEPRSITTRSPPVAR